MNQGIGDYLLDRAHRQFGLVDAATSFVVSHGGAGVSFHPLHGVGKQIRNRTGAVNQVPGPWPAAPVRELHGGGSHARRPGLWRVSQRIQPSQGQVPGPPLPESHRPTSHLKCDSGCRTCTLQFHLDSPIPTRKASACICGFPGSAALKPISGRNGAFSVLSAAQLGFPGISAAHGDRIPQHPVTAMVHGVLRWPQREEALW